MAEVFLSQFKGKAVLTLHDFYKIWRYYDINKAGFVQAKEVELFLKDLLATQGDVLSPEDLTLMRIGTFRRYDTNKNGRLEMEEILAFLPVEDNMIFRCRRNLKIDSATFVREWTRIDQDKTGYIDSKDLQKLLQRLLDFKKITQYVSTTDLRRVMSDLLVLFNASNPKVSSEIEFSDLACILNIDRKCRLLFKYRSRLTKEKFFSFFTHFDQNRNGVLDKHELYPFIEAIIFSHGIHSDTENISDMTRNILEQCDTDKDGKISERELGFLFTRLKNFSDGADDELITDPMKYKLRRLSSRCSEIALQTIQKHFNDIGCLTEECSMEEEPLLKDRPG